MPACTGVVPRIFATSDVGPGSPEASYSSRTTAMSAIAPRKGIGSRVTPVTVARV